MILAPIEDVIAAAERQAEIDWELEHRAPQPCEHESVVESKAWTGAVVMRRCADCGKDMAR